jgi:predicted permease
MNTLSQDLRYGAKMLWKSKGITLVAVISLAVGIGANSAIFSLVNSILLRPRAISHPEHVVQLYVGEGEQPYQSTSYPSYLDLRDHNDVLSGLAAYGIQQFKFGDANEVEQIWGEAVSENYFDVLGVAAQKGRTFSPDEDVVPRRNPVAVISHSLWQRRFNSDSDLIGKTITLNDQPLTVIGIAPPQYTGMFRGLASEIWIPMTMMPAVDQRLDDRALTSRGNRWMILVGRLKPETTLAQARVRFDLLTRDMQAAHPEEWLSKSESGRQRVSAITVLPESETRIPPGTETAAYAALALVFMVVNLVLLIACINLASMLLARAVTRRREMAVRLAIGASRFRIIRQLLTESVLLSFIAGAAGILLAMWLLNLIVAFMPPLPEGIRIALDLQLDWRVVIYTIVFSTVTGILFGLAPALYSSKADLSTVLKDDSSLFTGLYQKSRARMALVVVQVAFSLLLLIGAGLVLRSLEKIRPTRLGFSTESMVVGHVRLDEAKYDRVKTQEFYRQLSERLVSLPGVQSASLVDAMPVTFMGGTRSSIDIEGYQPGANEDMQINAILAGPRYFTNMKVPFVQGRDFEERDREGAPCVAVVNEAFGERYFRGSNSLGKHLLKYGGAPNAPRVPCEIVGVIHDNAWQSLEKQVHPFYALALQQTERKQFTVVVSSSSGDPASLIGAVRKTIRELDPKIPLADVHTLNDYFSVGLYPFRMLAAVMGGCGVMALLLATLGIYGIISYSVAQRTRELGIRMALGALRGDILRMVIGQGMTLVIIGLGVGLLLSFAFTRLMTSSLELELPLPVSATDPLTFAIVTVLMALVALIACVVPAQRATKVDPIEALRYE